MSLCYAVIFLLLFTKEISNNSLTSQSSEANNGGPAMDTSPNRLTYPNVQSYPTGDGGDPTYSTTQSYPTSPDNSTNGLSYQVGYTDTLWGDVDSGGDMGRRKRSAVQLYSMVSCSTGCDPLSYKGYGCYCGFLGSGYPVDPIDRCCELHDWCYTGSNCPLFLEYFIPYVWTCFRGRPLCQRGRSCSHRLCECDRRFSECLRPYSCPRYKAKCRSNVFRLMQNLILI